MTDIETYSYDSLSQLLARASDDGSSEGFTYDPMGNRMTSALNGVTSNYTHDAANQMLQAGWHTTPTVT